MESSIAVFLKRWQACELPPTGVAADWNTRRGHHSHPRRRARAGRQRGRVATASTPRACGQQELQWPIASGVHGQVLHILAEGAIALSVTLSGGALFAN